MRLSTLMTIAGALAFGIFISAFSGNVIVVENVPVRATTTTPTRGNGLSALPPVTLPSIELPPIAASTATSTLPATTKSRAKTGTPVAPAATTAPVSAAPTQAPPGDFAAASGDIRAALVNIICDAPAGGRLESISGSGVIIDPRGVILTNAHIGQYFLLADRGVSCVIRSGSPAADAYYAAPAFVSPAWLSANAATLIQSAPTGTGEHDVAVLVVTRSASNAPLPPAFPYVALAQEPPTLGEPVVIGSYAAQFLQSSQIESDLFPTIVYGAIRDTYTFETTTTDIVSLGGSVAAQEGSSGGGVVDARGNLVATITTSTTQGATSARELNAITASYIRRDYAAETGYALDTLLSERPSDMVASFAPQIPKLEAIITADL